MGSNTGLELGPSTVVMFKTFGHLRSTAEQRTRSVLHPGNRNSQRGQIRGKPCEAQRGAVLRRGQAPSDCCRLLRTPECRALWLVQVGLLAWLALRSCVGVRQAAGEEATDTSLPCRPDRAG